MSHDTFYILAAPGEMPRLLSGTCIPAWLTYRLNPDMTLLRLDGSRMVQGGVMVLSGCPEEPRGSAGRLCAAMLRECTMHQFRGILLDFDRPFPILERLARNLAQILPRLGITLFLPEWLAEYISPSRVLISSALSGGSLEARLLEAADKFGAERLVLAAEKTAEDFILPAPTGCGRPLAPEELENLIRDLRPRIHFSRPLCARYFIHYRDERVHFTLFDDVDTLKEKLACARSCGVHRFLLPWREISAASKDFLP